MADAKYSDQLVFYIKNIKLDNDILEHDMSCFVLCEDTSNMLCLIGKRNGCQKGFKVYYKKIEDTIEYLRCIFDDIIDSMHLFNIYTGDYRKALYGNDKIGEDDDIYANLCNYFAGIEPIKYYDVSEMPDTDEDNEASWKIVRKQLNILKNLG
jgi:hypothetical protein